MVFLGVLNALLEVAGISFLLHVVLSILRPGFISHNILTRTISENFGVTDQIPFVAIICTMLLVLYIVKNIVLVQINKAQVKYAYQVSDELSEKRYAEIAEKDLLYFKGRKSSDIINEIFGCTLFLPEVLVIPSIMLLSELSVMFLILFGVFTIKPFLFLFTALTLFPAASILIYINRAKLAAWGNEVHEINPVIYDNVVQLTQGIANIKLWNASEKFKDIFTDLRKDLFKRKESIYVYSQYVPIRIYEVVAILGILCLVLFAVFNHNDGDNLVNYVSIYAGVSFRLLPGVNRVLSAFNQLATNDYVFKYFDEYRNLVKKKLGTSQAPDSMTFNESIEMKNISFSYKDDDSILSNVSLNIQKGDCLGILGVSGTGKSTLVNILAALIPANEGTLFLDNHALKPHELDAYRFLFSYVRQDVFMLNKSIYDNIVFLKDEEAGDKTRVRDILQKVNLDTWVNSLENGLDTDVGELGNRISGGQKQRIAIARALFKNAEIFIFDEVTNNLDRDSMKQTLEAIELLKKEGKTTVFITHKKDELAMCNRIFELSNGGLVEKK